MAVTELSIAHHAALVLLVLWVFAFFGFHHLLLYVLALFYLYSVNERYSTRLRRRVQYQEKRFASQRRILTDSETVRWLNHAVARIWPIFMEQMASQQFLLPIIPWFLEKYKPWTVRKASVQQLYLGRNPPMFTEIRVLGDSANDDDHMVLVLGMNFISGDDMGATLAVQLRKRVGLGITTNMHITGMHVEGKVLVGVKFLHHWPFLGRMRLCFAEQPYFQMTVKPIFSHGIDVTELPGIAGWLDKLLAVAFEQTLVEPNMLVVDVEKLVSSPSGNWFMVDEKPPIAFAVVEILEGAEMKPSDLNGLADPYMKGRIGPYRFKTKIQKKTLAPKWLEEFKIPIRSWEAPNVLLLEVRDKDPIFDDSLGDCSVDVNNLRGGQRHDKWLKLQNTKTGRVRIAIKVFEAEDMKVADRQSDDDDAADTPKSAEEKSTGEFAEKVSEDTAPELADELEPINIEGQERTGVWVHHPGGNEVCQTPEYRKGRRSRLSPPTESELLVSSPKVCRQPGGSDDDDGGADEKHGKLKRGFRKLGSLFSDKRNEEPVPAASSPRPNIRAVGEVRGGVRLVMDDYSGKSSSGEGGGSQREEGQRGIKKGMKSLKSKMSSKLTKGEAPEAAGGGGSEMLPEDPLVIGGTPVAGE